MEIESKQLRNMMIFNFIIWFIINVIIKFFKPEYCNLAELILRIVKNKELAALFYVILIITYVITTYVLAIISVYIIGYMTIGKVIYFIKELFNLHTRNREHNMYHSNVYTNNEIILLTVYAFVAMPIMLYILLPALSVILIIILILIAVGSC